MRHGSREVIMNRMHRIGLSLFDVVAGLTYLLAGPTFSLWSFAWILRRVAFDSQGVSLWSWSTWVSASVLIYTVWLIWFLLLTSIETQVNAIYLRYSKPARATTYEGFHSWRLLSCSLGLYLRARLVLALPLVDTFLSIPGLRHLVLLSYSMSTRLGRNSLILGYLFDPDLTDIGDDSVIGSGSSIIGHSLTINLDGSRTMVTSRISIGARTVIGGAAQIHLGVRIGTDAIIEPASYVPAFTQIGDGEVWGGNPARFIRMRNATAHVEPSSAKEMSSDSLLDEVTEDSLRQIVAQALHRPLDDISPAMSCLETSAWDSLAQLGMSVELQKRFGILLTHQESFRLRSLCSLREVVSRSRAGASTPGSAN